MATIKLEAIFGGTSDWGTESNDFRGKPNSYPPHETHRTIREKDFGPDVQINEQIQAALDDGPAWNRVTREILNDLDDKVNPFGLLDGEIGLRICVRDE